MHRACHESGGLNMKLGKIVKQSGFSVRARVSQDFVVSGGLAGLGI